MAIDLSGMFRNLGAATSALGESVKGAPVPTDPNQRNAMQRAGVTNPLLQKFGQGIGSSLGMDMRSPMQQLRASMADVDMANPQALLAMAQKMKDIDPMGAAKLIQAYETAKAAKAASQTASYSGNDRFKDSKGNYYWATQQRTAQGPKMLMMDINGNVVDPAGVEGLQRVDADGLTASEKAEIERSKGFAEYDAKLYTQWQDEIGNLANTDRSLQELDQLLADPNFEYSILEQQAPELLQSDNMRVFNQIKNTLGLGVIGATTFGALSEGELNLALATALPPIKDKQKLREWVSAKREASRKLRMELSWATAQLRSGKSADKVREELMQRTEARDTVEGKSVAGSEVKTFTQQQWDDTLRNRGITSEQLQEILKSNGINYEIK